MNLSGQTALVTGAARRIGKATALALARLGADVVVHFRSSEAEARSVVAELVDLGVRSKAVAADLSDEDSPTQLFENSLELTGHVDIVVNSASIFEEATLGEVAPDDFRRNMQVNSTAPFLLARELYEHLRARGGQGVIVNFLDTRITDYDRLHVAYAVSKRALHTLTRMEAEEFAPLIRVNAVAPGLVLPPEGKDQGYLEELKASNPLNAYGNVQQVCDAVLFLIGAEFTTGQTIWVDGGRHMRGDFYGY
ncbi:MAG TPA: SDR family oxidoreductase [Spirochaetia bacterium]|nr:SDR family oxidoreductase [Spirochaetia bacterium]